MKQNNSTDIQSKIEDLERLLKDFKEKFEAGTSDAENFLTMHEIEQMWSELRGNTNYIYSDMLSELMSNVDERELIRKKKRVQRKRNRPEDRQTLRKDNCHAEREAAIFALFAAACRQRKHTKSA
jgi:hypothetical protein